MGPPCGPPLRPRIRREGARADRAAAGRGAPALPRGVGAPQRPQRRPAPCPRRERRLRCPVAEPPPVAGDRRPAPVPPLTPIELTEADYRVTGLSPAGHPLRHLRAALAEQGVT